MRGVDASVLVLTGLAALAGAKELQIDDVPVECATICGPIVELTFKCDVDNSFDELRRLKRRKVDGPEAQRIPPHAKGGVARRHHHRNRPPAQNEADVAVATPTQPQDAVPSVGDAQGVQQPAQDAQPPAQEASPVFIATLPFAAPAPDPQLSTPNPPPEAAQTTPSVEATPQQSTPSAPMSMPSAMPVAGEPGKKEPQPNPETDRDTAEKNCICGNKSFDVNLLAGMCQSCIKRSGNRANDMDFIMNQCNFTQATYTPDKDNLAYNIRVVAQKPLLSHSANAMGDAPRIGAASALAAIGVSFVAGMALLL
ncbi:hypothetical protein K4K60_002050 [Colletotrichum sp. SAR11_57]|nr:hypothetical protein K4K60_002050 [Colletotrichum sp. SAR11_57]